MNSAAPCSTGGDKETEKCHAVPSPLPLHFGHWKGAMIQGLQRVTKSRGFPQIAVGAHTADAAEQKSICLQEVVHLTECQQQGNRMQSVTDTSPTDIPSVIQIFMLKYPFT